MGGVLALGALAMTAAALPAQKPSPRTEAPRFRTVAVGQHFSCGLTYDGEAFCWGANYYGQLGVPAGAGITKCPSAMSIASTCAFLPVAVATTERFTDLSVGLKHVCGVSTKQTVWCWGRNEAGQVAPTVPTTCSPRPNARGLEEYAPSPCSFEPVRVERLPPARLVASGDDFSCALGAADDVIYCWGGSAGPHPRRLSADSVRFMAISAGYTNVCADTDDARVACWSLYGGISGTKWATAKEGLWRVATNGHTCAIGVETNHAYCWGFNAHGSLGAGSHRAREDVHTPAHVAGNRRFVRVAVSFLGTCAAEVSAGELFCWGAAPATVQPDRCASGSEFGGSSRCALTPQPMFPGNFVAVAVAVSHACGIAAAANAYCWGANDFGQLGNGTTRSAMKRPQIVGLSVTGGFPRFSVSMPRPQMLVVLAILTVLVMIVSQMVRQRRA